MNSLSTPRLGIHIIREQSESESALSNPNRCVGITGNPRIGTGRRCKRQVVWQIVGFGKFCHCCFEQFYSSNYEDIYRGEVIRLSNNEADFSQSMGNEGHTRAVKVEKVEKAAR